MKLRAARFPFRLSHPTLLSVWLISLCAVHASNAQEVPQAQSAVPQTTTTTEETAPKIPNDQLDSLVAPIALYPDPLLAQTLAASTYPLEIVQLQQWLAKNPNLKGKALAEAAAKQNWDPSIQALAALPDVVKRLAENISWTTDLGNAFLGQQADVMDAVQRMRMKAQGAGTLKTSQQQKVEQKQVDGKNVVVIEQADPQVVYVPTYNPTVIYGAPVYPYPAIYYPPPGAYVAGAAIAFGTGIAIGAAWNGGWGWNCGWGHGDIDVNIHNEYVDHHDHHDHHGDGDHHGGGGDHHGGGGDHHGGGGDHHGGGDNHWHHDPSHRGGAPYANHATANKFGGNAHGGPMNNRSAGGRQNAMGEGNRSRGGGEHSGSGRTRPGGGGAGERIGGGGTHPERGGAGERVGNRHVSQNFGGHSNAFGGSGGFSRSSAMASHNRGMSSMGRGGGFHGGGLRGGGRRR